MPAPGPFRPAWWLWGRHSQTVFPALLRRPPAVAVRRERWVLSDGDFVDVDRLEGDPGAPCVVVLHGLEGSGEVGYVRGVLARAALQRLRGLALTFRSCSREPNRALRSYHSGETSDLGEVLARLRAESPGAPLLLCGFSLGGNVLVKWLGEQGEAAPPEVQAAAAVSVPYDLALCARALDGRGPMAFAYRQRFLRTLKAKSLEKAGRFPERLSVAQVRSARTLREFDDRVTAKVHGFAGAADYYARSSSGPYVGRVRVPLLLLHAEDDPFIPPAALPVEAARDNPWVTLEVYRQGGHVGFVEGHPWAPRYYADRRLIEFLLAARRLREPEGREAG